MPILHECTGRQWQWRNEWRHVHRFNLTLPEAGSSNVNALSAEWNAPTPVGLNRLSWTAPVRGTVTVMDLGGKVIHAQDLAENQRTQWAKTGISIVNFVENGASHTWKIASH